MKARPFREILRFVCLHFILTLRSYQSQYDDRKAAEPSCTLQLHEASNELFGLIQSDTLNFKDADPVMRPPSGRQATNILFTLNIRKRDFSEALSAASRPSGLSSLCVSELSHKAHVTSRALALLSGSWRVLARAWMKVLVKELEHT